MDKIVITGGKKLKGMVRISGSKNAALPILVAALLTDEECVIENVPSLADIDTTISFLRYIGKNITKKGSTVRITYKGRLKPTAPYELVRRMRASVLVMGPLMARLGKVKVSLPGGCAIGARPIDIHLESFARMGATIDLKGGYVQTKAAELTGTTIPLRFASVGATENIMLAAVLAKGRTVIENAAREPEIEDLAAMLNSMGAKVAGAGTSAVTIDGVERLHGTRHTVIPDRIEAVTYLIAAAATKGDVKLERVDPDHIGIVIDKLKEAGLKVQAGKDTCRATWVKPLKPVSISTAVYPGFPTDVQAQWMALMATVKGTCTVEETVFENRLLHVAELLRLRANMTIEGNRVHITGVERISGAPVMVSDLRAGAALVIAGLVAEGKTEINRVYHLDRGYEHLEKKLRKLGATVRRLAS
jgi:UDP-N-acetylglucosamine 1-carboxyvinyltransferase